MQSLLTSEKTHHHSHATNYLNNSLALQTFELDMESFDFSTEAPHNSHLTPMQSHAGALEKSAN